MPNRVNNVTLVGLSDEAVTLLDRLLAIESVNPNGESDLALKIRDELRVAHGQASSGEAPPSMPPAPTPSEAERVAGKMAKAAREAAEDPVRAAAQDDPRGEADR